MRSNLFASTLAIALGVASTITVLDNQLALGSVKERPEIELIELEKKLQFPKDRKHKAEILRSIGIEYVNLFQHKKALTYFNDSLREYKRVFVNEY